MTTVFACPKCQSQLTANDAGLYCGACAHSYTNKNSVPSFIDQDAYWGEFSEQKLDMLLDMLEKKQYAEAQTFIDKTLDRKDFIFGAARSDFLYMMPITSDSVGLDTGCGLGVHTFNAARKAKHVYAFDQSLKRVRFCEQRKQLEKVDNITLFHADFAHLPFPDNYFDFIILNGVVEWLGEINSCENPRDDQLKVLRMLLGKLKKGGVVYIGIENRISTAYLKGRDHSGLRFTNFYPRFLADIVTRLKKHKPYRTYTYAYSGYRKLLEDAGFDLKDTEFYIGLPGYNLPQYIVHFDDIAGISFFIRNMSRSKGMRGKIISRLAEFPWMVKIMRHFFFSYLMYAKK